ncbi:MAG: carotenoid 1,2-hydratase [Burkholderiaceae bacterium]
MLCAAGLLSGRAGSDANEALAFARDFGSHPQSRIEWWYATGWLVTETDLNAAPRYGFQITFFRSRTGIDASNPSRFAARELIFAHAAVSDLGARRLRHDQRIARSGFDIAQAASDDTRVRLRGWELVREGAADASRYTVRVSSEAGGFGFELDLQTTQPVLLQGEAGLSRKGPNPAQTSRYYSQPQLAVRGLLRLDGQARAMRGRAWLDHEWSDALLDPQAVGWDWIGINLHDGAALTAFRVRRADGTALYAGGSWRVAGATTARNFGSNEVALRPGRTWASAATRAVYPVEWEITTPAGRHRVRALLDAQELDSRQSTGAVYWEGLSELLDERGARVGLGYLEMTGYVAPLRL